MMHRMSDPMMFWVYKLASSVHLRNITTSKVLEWKSAKERWSENSPRFDDFRVFGCHAEVLVPSVRLSNMDEKSINCLRIGYTITHRNYRFFNVENRRRFIRGRANFYENKIVGEISTDTTGEIVFEALLDNIFIETLDPDATSDGPGEAIHDPFESIGESTEH